MTGDTVIVSEVYSDEEDDAEFEREEERMGVYETDKIMTPSPRVSVEKIMLPSPRVSVEEHELPIMVQGSTSFEERIMAANPVAAAPVELAPCESCGRKFNPTALERHAKICEKTKSKPRKIFDAVNKLWKTDAEVESNKAKVAKKSIEKKKRPTKAEDSYKACEYCSRKFCDNAFDRHVEHCKSKTNRMQTSPPRDAVALAKLQARTKYNPAEVAKNSRRTSESLNRDRKMSNSSLYSEVSLPPWNLTSPLSPRNTPSYSSLTRAEGNLRTSKARSSARSGGQSSGTRSLGRAGGAAYLRQGDASLEVERDWDPQTDAKATTLSRNASGRGSIRKPALTKAALMRLAAGEKKAEEEENKRQKSEFGADREMLRNRAVTPSGGLMTRSAYGPSSLGEYGRQGSSLSKDRSKSKTPQLSRRSSSRSAYGRESSSPYSWQSFQPVMRPSAFRAEPDGIENDDDYKAHRQKDSLEGAYDHSKEYDPFKTAERQMQELLFGPTSTSASSSSTAPPYSTVQKPQPVRPSSTSAFSAYVPGRGLPSSSSPESPTRSYSYKPYTPSYSTNPSKTSGDYESPSRQSPPKLSSTYTRPSALSLMTSSDYSSRPGERPTDYSRPSRVEDSPGLARAGSLRASAARGNWKELFPSLSRQPSQPAQPATAQAAAATTDLSALARFCHECGNPFPMAHVRFCCECGVKRLYC